MKEKVLLIVLFGLLLNISVALMMDVIPAFSDMDEKLGIDGSTVVETTDEEVLDQFGNPLNGYPAMEDASNVNTNTLMDRVGLGAITSILNFFNKYLFGFVHILQSMFGAHVNNAIFVVFKTILGILYTLSGIELFTGTRFN